MDQNVTMIDLAFKIDIDLTSLKSIWMCMGLNYILTKNRLGWTYKMDVIGLDLFNISPKMVRHLLGMELA
jgi:hypothetical protein